MVVSAEMLCLFVEAGYESFGINRDLVSTVTKALDCDTRVSDVEIDGCQSRGTVFLYVRLECMHEEVALAVEVVEGGEQGIEGTLR